MHWIVRSCVHFIHYSPCTHSNHVSFMRTSWQYCIKRHSSVSFSIQLQKRKQHVVLLKHFTYYVHVHVHVISLCQKSCRPHRVSWSWCYINQSVYLIIYIILILASDELTVNETKSWSQLDEDRSLSSPHRTAIPVGNSVEPTSLWNIVIPVHHIRRWYVVQIINHQS